MTPRDNSNRLTGRGRRLLTLSGFILLMAGVFALFLGVTGRFLPHDERFLGMTADQLCSLYACRIVHFMIHDRVSFGGALACVGILYIWLAESPLKRGEVWAWWVLVLSGVVGFGSFFTYLGYGYLDTWHGIATLGLLPCFVLGLVHTHESRPSSIRSLLTPSVRWPWDSAAGFGRLCLLGTAVGLACGGLTILVVGMTWVFVPQDLSYMGLSVAELDALNPRLVPLIAHDRAGFGGAVCCCGIALFFCIWCGRPTRGLWWVLACVGVVGFGTAIGVHPAVGYNDVVHLAPAIVGALVYLTGLMLTCRRFGSSAHAGAPSPHSRSNPDELRGGRNRTLFAGVLFRESSNPTRTRMRPVVSAFLLIALIPTVVCAEELRSERDIPYSDAGGKLTRLDIYAPAEGKQHPVVVWIHGGGWRRGDKGNVQHKPAAFTSKGYVLVSINYRFHPDVSYKEQGSDIARAVRWVRENIGEYGGDPERLFLMGHSAGAHLAALVATDQRGEKLKQARCPEGRDSAGRSGVRHSKADSNREPPEGQAPLCRGLLR